MKYPNLFTSYPQRSGRDWLRNVSADDRKAFSRIGREAHLHGHLGGMARAAQAKRDSRGRFIKAG
jgi:hypothetical protein